MEVVITLIVGHRGVGKSTFLRQLKKSQTDLLVFDLDQEIEALQKTSVFEIFAKQGEPAFRELERTVLQSLIHKTKANAFIAVGAGFEGPIPKNLNVLWLRRSTDANGRCFLNRPRLMPEISPLEESLALYRSRDARFRAWAKGNQLWLPEGDDQGEFLLDQRFLKVPFDLTLRPEGRGPVQNVRRLEIREDWFSVQQVKEIFKNETATALIFAKRRLGPLPSLPDSVLVDFPLEMGPVPARANIVSLHERDEVLTTSLERLSPFDKILKLAVEIRSFSELLEGHNWWLADPTRRAFLPCSKDGRWRWYRSLFGPRMPIHYFRENEGSALDQPLLWQSVLQPQMKDRFAAVLGSPVEHSRSPLEHLPTFKEAGIPFVAIPISEEDWSEAWPVLLHLGLRFAAVTSPLKAAAFSVVTEINDQIRELQSVNTLTIFNNKIFGHNTDDLALEHMKSELAGKAVMVWGGGGVKSTLRKLWPQAEFVSARKGLDGVSKPPDLLIWAVGRSRDFRFPPATLRPGLVVDLNYTDDSPGLEWAVLNNLPYQSGLRMFKLQAEFQRRIWRDYI